MDGGSGANRSPSSLMLAALCSKLSIPIIVGGGITKPSQIEEYCQIYHPKGHSNPFAQLSFQLHVGLTCLLHTILSLPKAMKHAISTPAPSKSTCVNTLIFFAVATLTTVLKLPNNIVKKS